MKKPIIFLCCFTFPLLANAQKFDITVTSTTEDFNLQAPLNTPPCYSSISVTPNGNKFFHVQLDKLDSVKCQPSISLPLSYLSSTKETQQILSIYNIKDSPDKMTSFVGFTSTGSLDHSNPPDKIFKVAEAKCNEVSCKMSENASQGYAYDSNGSIKININIK